MLRTGWYNISREADLELPRISKEIPRRYKIKQRIAELYRQWSIEPTPFGTIGVRQSLEKRVCIHLAHLLEQCSPDSDLLLDPGPLFHVSDFPLTHPEFVGKAEQFVRQVREMRST